MHIPVILTVSVSEMNGAVCKTVKSCYVMWCSWSTGLISAGWGTSKSGKVSSYHCSVI